MPSHPTFYIKSNILTGIDLYNITFKIAADFEFLLRLFIKYKIRYKYVNEIWVVMLEGGISTKSFRSKLNISKEIIKSCKINNFYVIIMTCCIKIYLEVSPIYK